MSELPFHQLSKWQQQVFTAALLQRMLPNYEYFSRAVEFGNYSLLNNQLDVIWQWLAKTSVRINVEVQLDKLDEQIPELNQFDIFAVYPAIDACSALVTLLQSMLDKETECALEVSLLSINSVSAYLNFVFLQQSETSITEESLCQDPLMIWEMETQQEVFTLLLSAAENKNTVKAIKDLVSQQKLSNLAIEY